MSGGGFSRTGPLRPALAAALLALLAAALAAPFAVSARGLGGRWKFQEPPRFPKDEKRSDSAARLKLATEEADLPGLGRRLGADIEALVAPLADGERTGRSAGSAGADRAAEMIRRRFEKAGLRNITVQEFPVTVPVTVEAGLTVAGEDYRVFPLWPNLARTCTTNGTLKLPVVWAGDGRPERLAGKDVADSLLVFDGDRGREWLTACSLGARAAVFLEPASAAELQLGTKVLGGSLDVPRFWMPRAEGLRLAEKLRAAAAAPAGELRCRVDWQVRTARNVYGLLPGTDPEKSRDLTVLLAHYDSTSLVPDLAPGAEAAGNLAALLEVLERMKNKPPARSVLFAVVGAHYQSMAGEIQAAELLRRTPEKALAEIAEVEPAVLGLDTEAVLTERGLAVSGLRGWQRALLLVLGLLLLAAAGTAVYRLKLRLRPALAVLAGTAALGAAGLGALGWWFARERGLGQFDSPAPAGTAESGARFRAELAELDKYYPGVKDQITVTDAEGKPRSVAITVPGLEATVLKLLEDSVGRSEKADGLPRWSAAAYGDFRKRLRKELREYPSMVERVLDLVDAERVKRRAAAAAAPESADLWKAGSYAELRAKLGALAAQSPQLRQELLAVVERREAEERAATVARARLAECCRAEADRLRWLENRRRDAEKAARRQDEKSKYKASRRMVPPPADWLADYARLSADFAARAEAAVGRPAQADFRALRGALAGAPAQPGRGEAARALERCLTALEKAEDRQKGQFSGRLKYLRLAGNLQLLTGLGPDAPARVKSCLGLDLSSHAQRLAVFYKGRHVNHFVGGQNEKPLQGMVNKLAEPLARTASAHAEALGWVQPGQAPFMADTTSLLGNQSWGALAPGASFFGPEIFMLAGLPAITVASTCDGRRLLDTPCDLPERLDIEALARQTEIVARTLPALFRPAQGGSAGLAALESVESRRGSDNFLRIAGMVTEYNPAKSQTLSDTPVPGALVLCRRESRAARSWVLPAAAAVRPWAAATADGWGAYEFPGLPAVPARAWDDKEQRLTAFELEPATGRLAKVQDEGEQGMKRGNPWREPKRSEDTYIIGTFPCYTLNLLEAGDLRSFETVDTQFSNVTVMLGQGQLDAAAISWGCSMVGETPGETYPEHSLALFVGETKDKTGQPTVSRVKALLGRRRLAGTKWPLLAVPRPKTGPDGQPDRADQEKTYTGKGIDTRGSSRIQDRDSGRKIPASLMIAQDLYRLDDYRFHVLERAGVENKSLAEQHQAAARELARAEAARARKDWRETLAAARAAAGYEFRAYPNVLGTVTDVVKGLLFYLFLMLPFAYFLERLFFAFPDINRQLAGVAGCFLAAFLVLALVHPAFRITSSAPMILLAFITVALAILVIGMISSRFKREIEVLQRRPGKSRRADLDRLNAALSAFLLGINNMRRRRVRTALTTVTLVLLTFSVLSFSSIESVMGANRRPVDRRGGRPAYQGILVRNEGWMNLDEIGYRHLRDEFGAECLVAPRAWSGGTESLLAVAVALRPQQAYTVPGFLGVTADEPAVTGLGAPATLRAGRFFKPEEALAGVCLLSESLMDDLGLTEGLKDIRPDAPREALPQVVIGGETLAVIGVLANGPYRSLTDIDTESPVPVDASETWQRRSGGGAAGEALEIRRYEHLQPPAVPLVPYEWLMGRGGKLASVALVPGRLPAEAAGTDRRGAVARLAEDRLLRRFSMPMFVSDRDPDSGLPRVTFMSTARSNAVSGVGSLILPMLIAALIVLNTMLGAVYEREKEIFIYGALGLAPVHVGSLFIAESVVFAVVSAVLGYVLGQSIAKLAAATGTAEMLGVTLNYSSLSAVFSACFIIGVVVLSAAYPAVRAGQLSVPDVERIWKFPQPRDGQLVFDFPFTVSGEQALGVNMHLIHFFQDHANQSVGEFYTADTAFAARAPGHLRGGYHLTSRVWIAPFDFGISQRLTLETYLAADEQDIYETRMVLEHVSGSPDAWVKMNHRFMKGIRKQFLLWRLFTPEERAWHVAQARALLGASPPPAAAAAGPTCQESPAGQGNG